MFKYGIKLWSNNGQEIFKEAQGLLARRQIDFIELYIHPSAAEPEKFKIFKNAPVTVHATKYEDGFDVFELTKKKIDLFKKQIIGAADFLKADLIVVHAGIDGQPAVFKKNLKRIFDSRMVIENMPAISLDDQYFFGYSFNQLKWIKKNCRTRFCLDIGHAVKSAALQKLNYKDFLTDLLKLLKPTYFHMSGGFQEKEKDEHLNLFEGDIDWPWIKKGLTKLSKKNDIRLVFEVPKVGNNLDNYLKNIDYFNNLPL